MVGITEADLAMRTLLRTLELVAFVGLVWLATAVLRFLSGEPWASILHRPLWFLS